MSSITKNTKMFKGLKKLMPELNAKSLDLFTKWWDYREYVRKILIDRELKNDEIKKFSVICKDFLEFGNSKEIEYKKHKIKWSIMKKYLVKDIAFCDKLIIISNSINTDFVSKIKNNKNKLEKKEAKQ